MKTYEVTFSENNSGGFYALQENDYKNLRKFGWKTNSHRYATIRILAENNIEAIEIARNCWKFITQWDIDTQFCATCGKNFNFYCYTEFVRCADCGNYVDSDDTKNGYCADCADYNN